MAIGSVSQLYLPKADRMACKMTEDCLIVPRLYAKADMIDGWRISVRWRACSQGEIALGVNDIDKAFAGAQLQEACSGHFAF